jgi:hypothetical protein
MFLGNVSRAGGFNAGAATSEVETCGLGESMLTEGWRRLK